MPQTAPPPPAAPQDQGINVSNRAKELGALLASPDRIRCVCARARSGL